MALRNNSFENIVGSGENAGNQHFLLFPQCFLLLSKTEIIMLSANGLNLVVIVFNSTKRQNFRLVQIESVSRRQIKHNSKLEICFGKGRKHFGKRSKCWLPAIFSISYNVFQKYSFSRVVKSQDYVVKS